MGSAIKVEFYYNT